jgi:NADPH-dependent F420 reductase
LGISFLEESRGDDRASVYARVVTASYTPLLDSLGPVTFREDEIVVRECMEYETPDGLSGRSANALGAAAAGDVVLVVVPWDGHAELLGELAPVLAGKIVVDCVNPLGFDKQGGYALPVPEGSATQQAATLLPESRVVGAFHNVSAVLLEDPEVERIETDVLVLGDDREATDTVQALADAVPGMRGIYAGRLRNAHQVEALTANLISVNRRYKAHAGVRVTDV